MGTVGHMVEVLGGEPWHLLAPWQPSVSPGKMQHAQSFWLAPFRHAGAEPVIGAGYQIDVCGRQSIVVEEDPARLFHGAVFEPIASTQSGAIYSNAVCVDDQTLVVADEVTAPGPIASPEHASKLSFLLARREARVTC